MVMIAMQRCMEVAAGKPDLSSTEFRNAVLTIRARLKSARDPALIAEAQGMLDALLAHGSPQRPRKRSPEELADIRRSAGAEARRTACKNALRRKLDVMKGPTQFVPVTDRKPAVFDAALEMIEDGEALVFGQMVQDVYPGPISADGRKEVRRLSLGRPDKVTPNSAYPECRWKSERRQRQEAQI